jgi:hypothetical protein
VNLVLRYLLHIIKYKSENLKEGYHFEHLVIDGNIILKWALKEHGLDSSTSG